MANHTPSPRLPGTWLLFIAGIVFNESVLGSVAHQTIADLRDEWLRAGSDRSRRLLARYRGYVAFWSLVAMAPVAFRDWPATECARNRNAKRSIDMRSVSRTRLVVILFVAGLVAGNVISRLQPVLYESTAVIQVRPPRVLLAVIEKESLSETTKTTNLDERLRSVKQVILSRTRLEKLIKEFDLYGATQQKIGVAKATERMRERIRIEPPSGFPTGIAVSFSDEEARLAMKVTEQLVAMLIDEVLRDQVVVQEATLRFLDDRISQTGVEIAMLSEQARRDKDAVSTPRLMQLEVFQSSYKALIAKREEARTLIEIAHKGIGEQFSLVEPARLPEEPIGPTRLLLTIIGGVAGLAAESFIALAVLLHRFARDQRATRPATT